MKTVAKNPNSIVVRIATQFQTHSYLPVLDGSCVGIQLPHLEGYWGTAIQSIQPTSDKALRSNEAYAKETA